MKITGGAQRNMIMRKLMTRRSNVVVLKNMLTADELDEEVESEVTQECSQYGTVQRVVIYQEVDRLAPGTSLTDKISRIYGINFNAITSKTLDRLRANSESFRPICRS